ncbi:hypothetical protein [Croceicoccus marinus]|uniref:Uncharacterized protein n=1 Tax=Croceicoccus marinus TaxID=450378 RepID=A0A7G6VYN1_9SPHN|nr:hypothetical protein [Croceicoccus marinus]QNE06846.1 hypothetical protein H4O24_17355 [Croceicoccus marinus]
MTNPNRNRSSHDARPDRTIVAAHFEYAADREAYDAYVVRQGESAAYRLRWPFRKIVCGSWSALRFAASSEAPMVGPIHSRCRPECDETDIARAFFQFLESEMDEDRMPTLVPPTLVTWDGEALHVPSLRRAAQHHDLVLPAQLRKLAPDAVHRLDLREMLSTGREDILLCEYAHALGLPGLPVPALEVATLVEGSDWRALEEQCAATVMTSAIIAARHLASTEEVAQSGAAVTDAIVAGFGKREATPFTARLAEWHAVFREDLRSGDFDQGRADDDE